MHELIERANELSASWADAMVGVAWQSVALAAAVGFVCWLLRWQSPGLRYWLWLALAAKLLALPLWSVDVARPAWWGELGGFEARRELVGAASMVDESTIPMSNDASEIAVNEIETPISRSALESSWLGSVAWVTWLGAAWLAVIAIELGRTGWQFIALRRLLTESCAAEPAVRVVEGEGSPMVCGVRQATLVLPAMLVEAPLPCGERLGEGVGVVRAAVSPSGMGASRIPPLAPPCEGGENALRQIVLHELAHLQRRDLLTVWVIHLMRIVYWFNPVAHWVAYRAGLERELACDRLAMVNSGVSAATYAHTLIDAAGRKSQPLVLNAAVAARLTG